MLKHNTIFRRSAWPPTAGSVQAPAEVNGAACNSTGGLTFSALSASRHNSRPRCVNGSFVRSFVFYWRRLPAFPSGPSSRSADWYGIADGRTPMNFTNSINQAASPNLLIPARTLPVGQSAVAALTVCYAATSDKRACGTASTAFTVTGSPLVAALSGVNAVIGTPPAAVRPLLPARRTPALTSENTAVCPPRSCTCRLLIPRLRPKTGRRPSSDRRPPPLPPSSCVTGTSAVTLDCSRGSFDPDGEPGGLTFSWDCRGPNPAGCFTGTGAPLVFAPNASTQARCCAVGFFLTRCSGERTEIHAARVCSLNPERLESNEVFFCFSALLPLPQSFTLQANPDGILHNITCTVTKDARSASATGYLVAQSKPLPVVSVDGLSGAKVNPAARLVLQGSVRSVSPEALSVAWRQIAGPSIDLTSPAVRHDITHAQGAGGS